MNKEQLQLILAAALTQIFSERPRGTAAKCALDSGTTPQVMSDMKAGRSAGSEETRRKIAQALGYTYEQFLDIGRKKIGLHAVEEAEEDSSEYGYVRKVKAILGAGASLVTDGETLGFYAFKKTFFRTVGPTNDLVLFDVSGDSMLPTICDRDTVLVNTKQITPLEGDLFAVRVGNKIVVKRVFFEPKTMVLKSDNPNAGDFRVSVDEDSQEDFGIIGKVRWLGRVF